MILFHVGLALIFLVLITSTALIIWSSRAEPGPGIVLAKVVGIIIFILAILEIISLGFGVAKWKSWMHHGRGNACHCPMMSLNNINPNTNQTPMNQAAMANPIQNPNANQMQNQNANPQQIANPINNNTMANNANNAGVNGAKPQNSR